MNISDSSQPFANSASPELEERTLSHEQDSDIKKIESNSDGINDNVTIGSTEPLAGRTSNDSSSSSALPCMNRLREELSCAEFHGKVQGLKVKVVDRTCAGDAFVSGLLWSLASNMNLYQVFFSCQMC
ncbi:hypothetical protein FRX31_010678 [Thalictrum thalictroides]|uniref:Uncharacterized protein n=1 Tax=Thalictrum thalictroides TaxID=46969 RepID=A0A7J6WTD7_THATH|nr:hypothetical protein FRX31_010678 [Thalictrum thalictroides]